MSKIPGQDGPSNLRRGSPYGFGGELLVSRYPDTRGSYICDGTADNVQINAALDYVAVLGGGTVKLLEGTYALAAAVTIDFGSVRLLGMGRETELRVNNTTNINAIEVLGTSTNYVEDIIINGISVDGNRANNVHQGSEFSQNGLHVRYARNVIIRDCWVNSDPSSGIMFRDEVEESSINTCSADDNNFRGFYVGGTGNTINSSIAINSVTMDGIQLEGTELMANGNVCHGNDVNGIDIHGDSLYCGAIGNLCHENDVGIYVATETRCIVTGNVCFNNTTTGIDMDGGDYVSCTGNLCKDNGTNGILLANAQYCTVVGNYCEEQGGTGGSQDYGIRETGTSNNNVVTGNICISHITDNISLLGANTVQSHNLH